MVGTINESSSSTRQRMEEHQHQVIKVGGEMFDQEGYRVDVTVWFLHRNEALFCEFIPQLMLTC